MDSSDFPMFNDGDVKVWIDQKVYLLHSEVLRRHSRLFRHALQDAPQIEGFVYFYLSPSDLSKVGILKVQQFDEPPPVLQFLFTEPAKVREYWDNILRMLYKIKPNLDTLGLEPGTVASELIDLGEFIGSKAIVDQSVDLALQDLGQQLFLRVSRDPVSWLFFASRIRSGIIFHEAVIHLVGKWSQLTLEDHGQIALLPDYTVDILRESCNALYDAKETTEALLMRYSPEGTSLGTDTSPRTDTFMLKATSLFRQWLAHQMADGNNLVNLDGGTSLYRTIAAGGQAYLAEDKFDYFYGPPLQGGAAEASEIEKRLDLIKDEVKQIVAPLLVNESRYDPNQLGQLPYLTSLRLDVDTIPWSEWAVEDGNNGWSDAESSESESNSDDSWVSSVGN